MKKSELLAEALRLDTKDSLHSFRNQFVINDDSQIYLNGNSLGRLPKRTAEKIANLVNHEWGSDLVKSWNKGWYNKPKEIGDKIASIIGAKKGEVIVSDNTSTNLYKLVSAALNLKKDRRKIVTDTLNFPSDLYILDGIVKQLEGDYCVELVESKDGLSIDQGQVSKALDRSTALLTLSHVAFKSAYLYDLEEITKMAHECGALVLWDLSHSVGVVPAELHKCGVDLAVGCTYKYLNGGPGSPAFLYVKKELQEKLHSPVQGWFGVQNPFQFDLDYVPSAGIQRFLSGTPSILSLVAIEGGIDLIREAGIENIRQKNVQMSGYFIELVAREIPNSGFELASPKDEDRRGSHVALRHKEAFRINKALEDRTVDDCSVIADFRAPDYLRVGFSPLYNSYTEICLVVCKMKQIVAERLYEHYDMSRSVVT